MARVGVPWLWTEGGLVALVRFAVHLIRFTEWRGCSQLLLDGDLLLDSD